MTRGKPSNVLNISLWVVQLLLSISLLWSVYMKWFSPPHELNQMWPWTMENPVLTKITGAFDLLAALGLMLPMLFKIQPRLTLYSAYGLMALMIAAIGFHVLRGEGSQVTPNLFFFVLAAFVAYGRRHS